MTAARYDITIDQGTDFALELIVKESGNPKDFSDDSTQGEQKRWQARASFRKTFEDTTSYTLRATIDRDNPTLGKIKLSHANSDNAAALAGTYVYDLELYQEDISSTAANPPAEFSVTRLLGGNLTLKREVTR